MIDNLKKAGISEHYTHFLLTSSINQNSVLVDLGANEGKFYCLLNSKYNCTSHVVEASPTLYQTLPANPKTSTYHYAVGKQEGLVNFFLSDNPEANSLHAGIATITGKPNPITVEGISFENFLKKAGISSKIDVLKIDIEGAELDVLENISANSLKIISQIAVEFHDFLFKDADYLGRLKLSLKKLRDNNFLILKISNTDFREVLFVNRKLTGLNLIQRVRLTIFHPILQLLMTLHRRIGYIKNLIFSNHVSVENF